MPQGIRAGAAAADAQPKFTDELRAASRAAHRVSDVLVNARLLVLFTNRTLYGRALAAFYFVFQALEQELAPLLPTDPDLQHFAPILAKLARAQAFAKDMHFYLGPGWAQALHPSPAGIRYQQHLGRIAAREPRLLLAHACTQYMAIMAGGGIIRRMARRQMQLPEHQGTAAFEFESGSAPALASEFKSALNSLAETLTAEERQRLVDEHLAAFKYNNAIIRSFRIGWGPFLSGLFTLMLQNLVAIILVIASILTLVTALLMRPKAQEGVGHA